MITVIFLAGVLKWALMLLTLPLLVELLALTVAALLPASASDSQAGTLPPVRRLIALIPSHNEEVFIARCIYSLAAAAGSAKDIVVVAHNCRDSTAQVAAAAGARVVILNDPSLAGKGHALNHGLRYAFNEAGADAVLIIDADSTVSCNMIEVVLRRLSQSPVLQCRDQVRNYMASWRTGLVSLAFIGMNVIRPRGRDRMGLSCGIFGNGFAIRKEVLDHVPYTAHSIVEDMEFHLGLVEHGYQVRFVEEACVLADMPLSPIATATQRARWEGGRLRLLADRGPSLLGGIVRGKFTLLEPLVDLLSLPLALEVILLLVLLLIPWGLTHSYLMFAAAVITFHLAVVIQGSSDRRGSVLALARAPFYILGRVSMFPSIVRASRSGAAWIRTHRDSSSR